MPSGPTRLRSAGARPQGKCSSNHSAPSLLVLVQLCRSYFSPEQCHELCSRPPIGVPVMCRRSSCTVAYVPRPPIGPGFACHPSFVADSKETQQCSNPHITTTTIDHGSQSGQLADQCDGIVLFLGGSLAGCPPVGQAGTEADLGH